MTIVVTGVAGFIGSHLADRLSHQGAKVVGVDILPEIPQFRQTVFKQDGRFTYGQCDLRKESQVFRLFNEYHFEEVYHLAANMGGIGYITQPRTDIVSDNLRIDLNMVEMCTRTPDPPTFLYASSACIYPQQLQEEGSSLAQAEFKLSEQDAYPANPDSHYGWEKLTMERLGTLFAEEHGLPIRLARFHNIYGPGIDYFSERSKVIGSLIRKAVRYPAEGFRVWGDGQQSRSFCYIDDLVEGLIRLMASDWAHPINLGSEELITIRALAEQTVQLSGKTIPLQFDPTKPQGVRHRNADITLAREVLGWEPQVPLSQGLKHTYEWIQAVEAQGNDE